MKYELIKTDISAERTVFEQGVPTNDYEVTITLGIAPIDDIAPEFSKDIIVRSSNSMTGFQVDDQRELAIDNYLQAINMDI